MLSVANVRTAGGAANYFAADNYYTRADADRSGEWMGKGAAALGLEGTVDARQFEAVLKGMLSDGSRVGSDNRAHRAGTDLTFSMPKSWSVLALVGGDKRILDAYAAAVRETLRWAEKNLAETRMEVRGRERVVQTGNLAIALFQHDTNRNQEPNAHFHAVIANVTRGPDGKWRALRNDKVWEHNTLLNAMTMARFRLSCREARLRGRGVRQARQFRGGGRAQRPCAMPSVRGGRRSSTRLATMEGRGLAARSAANLMTRADKGPDGRTATRCVQQWREAVGQGWALMPRHGHCHGPMPAAAHGPWQSVPGVGPTMRRDRSVNAQRALLAATLAERLGLREGDPLDALTAWSDRTRRAGRRRSCGRLGCAASGRAGGGVLAGRDLPRSAWLCACPTSLADIEQRVDQLLRQGHLEKGGGADRESC